MTQLPDDPCEVLTLERITELFGSRVRGRFEEGRRADVCGYRGRRPADPNATPPVPSGLDVFVGEEFFVVLSRQAEPGLVVPLPSVAASAYVAGNSAGAIVGDQGLLIEVFGLSSSDPAVGDLLEDLLREAVGAG